MGMWKAHAARAAIISLLCLVAAVLPGTGFLRAVPQAATQPIDVAVAAEFPDEPPGTVNQHLYGTPIPTPAPTPDTRQLLLAELTAKKAPLPSGPATYVPILLYHYIRVNPNPRDGVGFSLSTPPAMFRMQMQYLADQGFHVISLHEAVVAIAHHTGLPYRPVVLTFDDGYADFFTQAVPVLLSHGFTATDFVISGRMGLGGFMTASQVIAADSMGFNIGAHTVDHVSLGFLAPARATWEMRQSKTTLEALLGHSVVDFAYPYGSFNSYVMGQARSLGFETAVSTLAGTVHSPGQLYELSRMRIGGGLSLGYFAHLVGGPPPTAAELRGAGAPPTPPTAAPQPTPSPTPTPTPAPTPAPTPTPTPTPTSTPTPTPTPTPTSTPTATPSATPSPSPS